MKQTGFGQPPNETDARTTEWLRCYKIEWPTQTRTTINIQLQLKITVSQQLAEKKKNRRAHVAPVSVQAHSHTHDVRFPLLRNFHHRNFISTQFLSFTRWPICYCPIMYHIVSISYESRNQQPYSFSALLFLTHMIIFNSTDSSRWRFVLLISFMKIAPPGRWTATHRLFLVFLNAETVACAANCLTVCWPKNP